MSATPTEPRTSLAAQLAPTGKKRWIPRSALIALASRLVCGVVLLLVAGALPWMSRIDPAAAILRARYAELEPSPEALAAVREQLGLDRGPLAVSLTWWKEVFQGNLGHSWVSGSEVGPGAFGALGVSLTLTVFALVVAFSTLIALITPASLRVLKGQPQKGSGPVGVALTAMPEFLLASALLVIVGVQLQWLPPYGWTGLDTAILPALALGLPAGGLMGRLMADAISGVADERWVQVWRLAGARPGTILCGVYRRALTSIIDQVGLVFIGLLGGAVAVEQVFAIPGIGRYLLGAAKSQDIPALQAGILLIALIAVGLGAATSGARLLLSGGRLPAGSLQPPPEAKHNPKVSIITACVSGGLLVLMLLFGLFRDAYSSSHERIEVPSLGLPFGADPSGRDVLARVANGALETLIPAFVIVLLAIIIGTLLSFLGEAVRGPIEIANATPPILAGVIIAALTGPSIYGATVAVLWVTWPPLASHAASLIEEAKASAHIRWLPLVGAKPFEIWLFHIVPAMIGPLLRHGMLRLPGVALSLAALGFLGLGARPPRPEWGLLLSEGIDYVERAPWVTAAPASALILISVLAVALAGVRKQR
ncbi:ABC transporter permease subunit [Rothia sp. ZJ932]|uniref:ABC transporter permease subunit n=1 Tax=Rothia sp. ZJ932 TaxID=2810516 RepID=UPI001F083385|nr:ABC transporter permease subunit [Rothia sp. ZJ932]